MTSLDVCFLIRDRIPEFIKSEYFDIDLYETPYIFVDSFANFLSKLILNQRVGKPKTSNFKFAKLFYKRNEVTEYVSDSEPTELIRRCFEVINDLMDLKDPETDNLVGVSVFEVFMEDKKVQNYSMQFLNERAKNDFLRIINWPEK